MKVIRVVGSLAFAISAQCAWSQTTETELWCTYANYNPCFAEGDPILNPATGEFEIIEELIFTPYGSVLTDEGYLLWAGPVTPGTTFTIPGTPYRPALDPLPPRPGYPERPEVPAITYTVAAQVFGPDPDEDDDDIDPPLLAITCTPTCGNPDSPTSLPLTLPLPTDTKPGGLDSTPGQSAVVNDGPAPAPGLNRFVREREGRWGDSGDSGWGVEICFFGCWTIGESADAGYPGDNGPDQTYDITLAETFGRDIVSNAANAPGISVASLGGRGGSGGNAWGALPAANGGIAGEGGNVDVTNRVDITTSGTESHGMFVLSRAGLGGTGGDGYILGDAGSGGPAAQGGTARATNYADIATLGDGAIGIFAQSLGGGGGNGGSSYGLVGDAGSGSEGGHGDTATAINYGTVSTGSTAASTGAAAHGVFAQSVGGAGGNAGDANTPFVALGGNGGAGGNGAAATAINGANAQIVTRGVDAVGLYAQSIGGGGGDGGSGIAITGIGGTGGGGGEGRTATANNLANAEITTLGVAAYGILAQSVGGGGGNGGDGNGIVGIGGQASVGGSGGHAQILNEGTVETRGEYAHGMLAQSIGGGGGSGGSGGGLVAIGGGVNSTGFNTGGRVDVTNSVDGEILTRGASASGIMAQSIGGGGGTGAGSTGLVAIGGAGAMGGNGLDVHVNNRGSIETLNLDAKGILAQSIGGGGGSSTATRGAVNLGGSGAGGGNGNLVEVNNYGSILTRSLGSDGIFAQSIGGGGGNGASAGGGVVGLGGSGGGGGDGGAVRVLNQGSIVTGGARARGIMAESIGGGGGSGGDGGGLVAIGGSGGDGGDAGSTAPLRPDIGGDLVVRNEGLIFTFGNQSTGIEARSVGGGGGSGGSVTAGPIAIGGTGGDGGRGGHVDVTNNRDIETHGTDSHGIFAQSVGGGGGNGGNSVSASVFGGVALGGSGGRGGDGNIVSIGGNSAVTPTINTSGDRAKGIFAQSIGGGGGNGGFSVQASGGYVGALSASVGGRGGSGGIGNRVEIDATTDITTGGFDADGILAQSVGGGGGNGGFAMSFAFSGGDVGAGSIAAGIGGRGGNGGAGGQVDIDAGGSIRTAGDQSEGLIAQSIGGGGGNGGYAITIAGSAAAGGAGAVSAAIGGDGGDGGVAGQVDVDYTGDIRTGGDQSTGVVAQAVGGGGGNGGYTIAGSVSGGGAAAAAASVGVGGAGGGAGAGGVVHSTINGNLTTEGDRSTGMVVQSVGGRGGNGGFNISGAISGAGAAGAAVSVGVGGSGGGGGNASTAAGTLNGDALTLGRDSDAVLVQSVGGGGGNGGFNVTGSITGGGSTAGAVSVGIGGAGGGAGNGVLATGIVNGDIATIGDGSSGLVAQSVGGGGGNGGFNVSAVIVGAGTTAGGASVGLGGAGGGGGAGGAVVATLTGSAYTRGNNATAIVAQSVGGGGGNGGFNVSGSITGSGANSAGAAVGLGGSGGGGGASGQTTLTVVGDTLTEGHDSGGVLAQSVAGGGGNGGFNVSSAVSASGSASGAAAVGLGGSGGTGGFTSGTSTANVTGNIVTRGNDSIGLTSQSIGGGGGNGGFNVTGTVSASGGTSGAISVGLGGSGGGGGAASTATGFLTGDLQTLGRDSDGVLVQSIGGGGGNGGFNVTGSLSGSGSNAGAISVGLGGSGGGAGNGGAAVATITGNVMTSGDGASSLIAQSVGGGGGNGGFNVSGSVSGGGSNAAGVAVGLGGSGGGGGNGGAVTATVHGNASTRGDAATAIIVQSLGGGGGVGGMNVTGNVSGAGSNAAGVTVGLGGAGGGGGDSALTTLEMEGNVDTSGDDAGGILVQSVGGGGGAGGMNVTVDLAASGSSAGAVSVGLGGSGGLGGDGSVVSSSVTGNVVTRGERATGYVAQSLGGGGGNGGMNVTGTLVASGSSAGAISVGLGGSGGGGGDGRAVTASLTGNLTTVGDDAYGALFQSVGGGGGNGGMNLSSAVSLGNNGAGALAVGVGGSGGGGGDSAAVVGTVTGNTATGGNRSFGVLMQSVGGGGGNGGMNITAALSLSKGPGGSLGVGVGGFGGDGGDASTVTGTVSGLVLTTGTHSTGVLAQSVGGGGGNGGMNVSGAMSVTKESGAAVAIGVGGFGGGGGNANTVSLTRVGATMTQGANSDGVVAQSIGGGGGNGGLNVSGALGFSSNGTAYAAALGLGGFGGDAGDALGVEAHVTGAVRATGLGSDSFVLVDGISRRVRADGSNGVLAQSVGGSGGNGAINVSGGIAFAPPSTGNSHTLVAGVGGFGGLGGNAAGVTLEVNADLVEAVGDSKNAITAQSIGGGGGNGGLNVSGGIAMDGLISLGVGGFGGGGGRAEDVIATANTDIRASGAQSVGFLAQSVGGGGGTGAMNISGGLQGSTDTEKPALVFGLGGFGGAANVSGTVTATQTGTIAVDGSHATGVLVQSIAGGGGAGGLNVSGLVSFGEGYAASIGIGGNGGAGANAESVTLVSDGNLWVNGREALDPDFAYTGEQRAALQDGEFASGIVVQSIGGGGGTGAMNVAGVQATESDTAAAGVGGSGSGGGHAGSVRVDRGVTTRGLLRTDGNNAIGLLAQSIGGGGGNAGMNFAASSAGNGSEEENESNEHDAAFLVAVGGNGGTPGNGNTVDVDHRGDINTTGDGSAGIVAQSIGGGGGNAAYNLGIAANKDTNAIAVAVGGGVGAGGDGEAVTVDHDGIIETLGRGANAITAQSIGGGGGNAGTDLPTSLLVDSSSSLTLTIGRVGGTGGVGRDVTVTSDGTLITHGDGSVGVFAQSAGMAGGSSGAWGGSLQRGDHDDASQVTVSVGLEGGEGGHAGNVEVDTSGVISTSGIDAYAIQAQSVGGGGGGGGSAFNAIFNTTNSIAVGVGASGGHGAAGGRVAVDNDAELTTRGDGAHAIFVTSTGGGGGVGGYAGQFRLPGGENSVDGSTAISSQVGGNGGTGATGGAVDVLNRGSIVTLGRHAFGVNAQSVGGGGGFGGMVFDGNFAGGGSANSLTVNIGGSGDTGGTGGTVDVVNEGVIHTVGDESAGIRAQSIGGSGGDAGIVMDFIVAATRDTSLSAGVRLGGDGGEGGTGGAVTVTNRRAADATEGGEIVTEGRSAHGIFAQSLGGGGGNGSSILTANFTGGQGSITGGVNIGGDGGEGGVAGAVHVINDSRIDTLGDEAHGVFAQSIGGGGGNGGLVLAANAIFASNGGSATPMVVLGGSGGAGNDAGDVTVDNSGEIVTRGARSQGILAQSIGGGGGNANIGLGVTSGAASTTIAGLMSAAFGGRGGEGGQGGHVTVNHSGDITVSGENSQAVVAESINGGGGHVTLDFTGVTSLPGGSALPNGSHIPQNPSGGAADPVIVFNGGGVNQQNSDAGRVTLNYTGTFGVAGNNGAANAVQAIGGGGGTFDVNLGLNDMAGSADDVAIEGRLGGVGGTNNRGGDIESMHDGDLVTEGNNTPGALVQSIGGGGGRANLALTSSYDSIGATDLTLGGENGNNEEGGDIDHTQSGSVYTSGVSAHGGVFQSVGGGGGAVSVLADNGESAEAGKATRRANLKAGPSRGVHMQALLVPSMTFGSAGGSTLSGGDVSLALDGNVETTGDNSIGMIFQSVGAGGGIANVLGVDGLSVSLGGSNGASGNGGALAVENTGDVLTAGLRSHGVFLQSIGGGGSAVFTDAAAPTVSLSTDNAGNGGDITFVQNGTIATYGDHAYSLFAQSVGGGGGYVDGSFAASAGGTGTAGAIDLALNGDIAALGDFSTALMAQSTGANGLGGNITANLSAGNQLVGGLNGVAVYFDGGAANRFANYGTVRTLSGPEGFAFRGGAGGDLVDNHGIVMGNVDLAAGTNRFANNVDGTFYSGTTVNLGDAANVLRNDGLIAPGAGNLAVHTHLAGSFVQSATGTSNLEINFAMHNADRITASGTANVSGTINLSLLNVQNIQPGMSFQPLYIASGGASASGIAFNPQESIVIDYRLANQSANVLGVEYEVDFSADGLTGNRVQIGEYLNRVQMRGGPGGLGDTITAAVLETSLDDYAFMLTQLGTEFYTEQQSLALNDVQRFSRNLQSCGTSAVGGPDDDTSCYWMRYDDNPSSRQAQAGFPAAESESYSFSQGVQFARDGGWTLGFAMDFADYRSSGFDGLWTSDSEFFQVGANLRHDLWGGSVGATLQLGHNAQSVTRLLGVTDVVEAQGNRSVLFLSDVLDYTYDYTTGGFSLQPSLSFGASFLRYGDMTEHGAESQNAVIYGGNESHLWVEPAIGGRYVVNFGSGGSLRTFARVGVLQYLSGTSTKVYAGLEGAPLAAAPMRIGSDLDRAHVVGEAGLQYMGADGFTLGFSYTHQESDTREGGAGSLRFLLPLK